MQPEFPDEDIMALFATEEDEDDERKWVLFFDGASKCIRTWYRSSADFPKKTIYTNDRKVML